MLYHVIFPTPILFWNETDFTEKIQDSYKFIQTNTNHLLPLVPNNIFHELISYIPLDRRLGHRFFCKAETDDQGVYCRMHPNNPEGALILKLQEWSEVMIALKETDESLVLYEMIFHRPLPVALEMGLPIYQ